MRFSWLCPMKSIFVLLFLSCSPEYDAKFGAASSVSVLACR
jgi:hypothetical protein